MTVINRPALERYDLAAFDLIPLHKYDATSRKHGRDRKDGKRPLHYNWTVRKYFSKDVLKAALAENSNVGIRLKPGQLVIDVDPRNGGEDGFAELCKDLDLNPAEWPRVITGSGGSHFYLTMPTNIPIVDTLPDYPGVEFKSRGRQVVAAGSIHPDTKKHYEWDDDHPDLDAATHNGADAPPCPKKLLVAIRRPQRSAVTNGGQYTQAQAAYALASIDATKYREHSAWLSMMMAVHHATNGDARGEFVEWSCSDPQYSQDAELIGRRWDSLHANKEGGVTYKTFEKAIKDHGDPNRMLARDDAADDFDTTTDEDDDDFETPAKEPEAPDEMTFEGADDDEDDGVPPENWGGLTDDALSMLEDLNTKYVSVIEGGKFKIIYKENDPVLNRDYWIRLAPVDFMLDKSNEKLERATKPTKNSSDTIPLGKAWIEWPRRNHVKSVIFAPFQDHKDRLNLFEGYAFQGSAKGSWDRLKELIHEVLCDGDDAINDYVLNWIAYLYQQPMDRAEVALVFRGGRGTGKGTLGNIITKTIGRHAMAIASPELITGRFNSHLQDLLFLFADEAVKPYDKNAENRLKNLITEPFIAYEAKGRDVVPGLNCIHVMMATNDEWAVPAAKDERRFLVADVNAKWQGRHDLWEKLHAEMRASNDSGFKRFLFDMQARELGDFHPRKFPVTHALIDQKIRSFSPLATYFFNACCERVLRGLRVRRGPWETEPVRFFLEDLRIAFSDFCRAASINPGAGNRANTTFFLKELAEIFPTSRVLRDPVEDGDAVETSAQDGRAKAIEIPSLAQCRKAFEDRVRGAITWPVDESDDAEDFG